MSVVTSDNAKAPKSRVSFSIGLTTKCMVSSSWVELGRVHLADILKLPYLSHTLEHSKTICGGGPGTVISNRIIQ